MHKILRYGLKTSLRIFHPVLNSNAIVPTNNANSINLQQFYQKRNECTLNTPLPPHHLVCLKDWDANMVNTLLVTAMKLKYMYKNTHGVKLEILPSTKVMILEDHNEPILRMAASKATSLLGADDVLITEKIRWDQYYYGKIYSEMADIILVSTETQGTIRRFVEQSDVPVVCMRSRRHATVQSLATIMSIIEEYGTLKSLNLAYVGSPHQVLNDYLILCPLLGAHLKFKCCCKVCPVSPLMLQDCKKMCKQSETTVEQVTDTSKALWNVAVVIAGPGTKKEDKIPEFELSVKAIQKSTNWNWTFYHTCPWGKEVEEQLFWHSNSRTYEAFKNTQYITAALIIVTLHYAKQCHPKSRFDTK